MYECYKSYFALVFFGQREIRLVASPEGCTHLGCFTAAHHFRNFIEIRSVLAESAVESPDFVGSPFGGAHGFHDAEATRTKSVLRKPAKKGMEIVSTCHYCIKMCVYGYFASLKTLAEGSTEIHSKISGDRRPPKREYRELTAQLLSQKCTYCTVFVSQSLQSGPKFGA